MKRSGLASRLKDVAYAVVLLLVMFFAFYQALGFWILILPALFVLWILWSEAEWRLRRRSQLRAKGYFSGHGTKAIRGRRTWKYEELRGDERVELTLEYVG